MVALMPPTAALAVSQTITVTDPNPASRTLRVPTYQINASTNSDGTLGYAVTSGSCSVGATGLISIVSPGPCDVTITAFGGIDAAATLDFTLNVAQGPAPTTTTLSAPGTTMAFAEGGRR